MYIDFHTSNRCQVGFNNIYIYIYIFDDSSEYDPINLIYIFISLILQHKHYKEFAC